MRFVLLLFFIFHGVFYIYENVKKKNIRIKFKSIRNMNDEIATDILFIPII